MPYTETNSQTLKDISAGDLDAFRKESDRFEESISSYKQVEKNAPQPDAVKQEVG